jgi:hypothetical protein
MSRGRLEAQIYQATNWTATLTVAGFVGSAVVTVAASSTRHPADFLTALEAALDSAATSLGDPDQLSVSASWFEGGTGRVLIEHDAGAIFTLTWISTDMRDLLGYTGNLTGANAYTATGHAQGVWLPDCPMASKYGPNDPGHTEADRTEEESPRGDVWALQFQSKVILPSARWSHVTRARARIAGEVIAGESFERWWRNTHGGELAYFAVSPQVRLIWDADVSGTYHTYRLKDRKSTAMERAVEEWAGLWPIEIVGVLVPS